MHSRVSIRYPIIFSGLASRPIDASRTRLRSPTNVFSGISTPQFFKSLFKSEPLCGIAFIICISIAVGWSATLNGSTSTIVLPPLSTNWSMANNIFSLKFFG